MVASLLANHRGKRLPSLGGQPIEDLPDEVLPWSSEPLGDSAGQYHVQTQARHLSNCGPLLRNISKNEQTPLLEDLKNLTA